MWNSRVFSYLASHSLWAVNRAFLWSGLRRRIMRGKSHSSCFVSRVVIRVVSSHFFRFTRTWFIRQNVVHESLYWGNAHPGISSDSECDMTMHQAQVVLPARLLCLFYHTCLDTYAFSFSRSCFFVRLPLSPAHAHTCREQMTWFSHAW